MVCFFGKAQAQHDTTFITTERVKLNRWKLETISLIQQWLTLPRTLLFQYKPYYVRVFIIKAHFYLPSWRLDRKVVLSLKEIICFRECL